jgi:hypothetical protein
MEKRKPLPTQVVGLILAGLLIIVSVVFAMVDRTSRPGGGWITYCLIIAGLIYFINLYAKANDNYVTFGDLFSYGFKSTAVMTLVFLIFIVILAIAMPEMKKEAIEASRAEMAKNKSFSDADVEKGLQLVEKYFWVFMAGATMIVFLIVGCIGSLIGAAIPNKKPKVIVDQLDQPTS